MEFVLIAAVLSVVGYFVLAVLRIERFGNFVGAKLDTDHKYRMALMSDNSVSESGLERVKLAMTEYPLIDVDQTYDNFENSRIWQWDFEKIISYRENDSLIDIVRRSAEANENNN